MIDPLNIFGQIKDFIKSKHKVDVYAFGSRARGTSSKGKWDFDVAVLGLDKKVFLELQKEVISFFESKKDENNKQIKIDLFNISNIDKFKNIKHAVLL